MKEKTGGLSAMTKLHQPFLAMAQGRADYTLDVILIESEEYGPMMTVCATEEAVYITKQQAMDFFGLVEAGELK